MTDTPIETVIEAVVGVVALVLLIWLMRKRLAKKSRNQ
jgi:predicted membrane-bound mannosyltransferase